MIIVDTSVWVDFYRGRFPALSPLLASGKVGLHPFVLGELALGGFPTRGATYESMTRLQPCQVASPSEALALIDWADLQGTGIGYVDAHLLVSARLTLGASLLTRDKRLRAQAERLGLAYAA